MIRMINYCQNYCMYFYDMLHVVLHYMTGRLHVQLVHRQTGLCKEVFSFTERPKKIFFYVIIGTMMEYNNCLRKGTIFFGHSVPYVSVTCGKHVSETCDLTVQESTLCHGAMFFFLNMFLCKPYVPV